MEHQINQSNTDADGRIEAKLNDLGSEKKEEILANFDQFKSYLGDKVSKGMKLGLDEEHLANAAQKVGDYLAQKEEPRNREEKLLQELWQVGNQEEKHMLAHMLVRLVH
ncbi:DUF3243 domain-containing protein [Bacillus sp. V33-4]|uniref:DUF3243 domain-containing protein n=1 Tax=Bacillus sp. V33-4 TaxID=2054169 RepID=UPI000C77E457|nr:DUF3243 domain-containing protein [Bacillus sp. V33-4]PLR85707.1 DUF3243 domain-containing protein [Bacillus sp. V33-4]